MQLQRYRTRRFLGSWRDHDRKPWAVAIQSRGNKVSMVFHSLKASGLIEDKENQRGSVPIRSTAIQSQRYRSSHRSCNFGLGFAVPSSQFAT